MKYKVGDRVRIIGGSYEHADGFRMGDVFTVTGDSTRTHGGGFIHGTSEEMGDMIFFATEVEAVDEKKPAADLTLTLDIPTEAMKEFADHCERAAAALERIKAALA